MEMKARHNVDAMVMSQPQIQKGYRLKKKKKKAEAILLLLLLLRQVQGNIASFSHIYTHTFHDTPQAKGMS